jgi:hypothetical protein
MTDPTADPPELDPATAGGSVPDDAGSPDFDLAYELANPSPAHADAYHVPREQDPDGVARFLAMPELAAAGRLFAGSGTAAYRNWVARGKPFTLAYPLADLMAQLRRDGYTVYAYPDESHLRASTPEDHDPFSATGWPGVSPFGWGMAIDIMPPRSGSGLPSLAQLGRQMLADKINGVPGMSWLKYLNWEPGDGSCKHESFQPNHVTRSSSDRGHLHASARTDLYQSRVAAGYNPVARVRAGGSAIVVPVQRPAESGGIRKPAPPWPGRVLIARAGKAMMHGTDVTGWQREMQARGWSVKVDGWYGDKSADLAEAFQRDSSAHGWHLDVDRKVGPATWRATWERPTS